MGICEKFLSEKIEFENLMEMIDVAEKFEGKILKNSILDFIKKNFDALMENQTCYLLPYTYLWEVAAQFREISTFQK